MHITKKSIFRKLSIISLAALIFVSSLLGSSVNSAHAVGVDTVVKLVGGKAVVRALAEKAGVALSKKQVDNVAGFIEKKTFDGDPKAIEFANKANNLTSSGSSIKEGFKKYLLDPGAWLLGLDLIFLAVDAFQDGYDGGTPVSTFGKCLLPAGVEPPASRTQILSYDYSGFKYYLALDSDTTYTYNASTYQLVVTDPTGYTGSIMRWRNSGSGGTFEIYGQYVDSFTGTAINVKDLSVGCVGTVVPTAVDVINTTNVPPSVINHFDNDTYNQNTTYNIEIEMPDVTNYDDMTPWNEPDPKLGEALETIEKPDSDGDGIPDDEDDSDGDGVTDDKDSDADKGGWLENLLPIVTLIIIFDLLKAVIFYLARMFEFILTIPLIEAKPIDNVAFEWFRNAEIVGIEIYSVISLLATIGLSFAVYKVVRRLLP